MLSSLACLLYGLKSPTQQRLPWLAGMQTRPLSTLSSEQAVYQPPGSGSEAHAAPMRSVVFLHGLMGSGRNWRTFSRKLGDAAAAATHTPWRMVLLDLRCHGASAQLHHMHPPHTLQAAAQDVAHFIRAELGECPPTAVVGHSLGGKVLLELLRLMAHERQGRQPPLSAPAAAARTLPFPPQAWVLDSQPGQVSVAQDERTGVARVLRAVKEIKTPILSRTWLANHLKHDRGFDTGLSQWLGSSVVANAHGQLVWTFNIPGVTALYHDYMLTDSWAQLHRPPPGVALHLVTGGQSDRWSPPVMHALRDLAAHHAAGSIPAYEPGSTQAGAGPEHAVQQASVAGQGSPHAHGTFKLHTLAKAGHNLHIEDPAGLLQLMLPHVCASAIGAEAYRQ